MDDPIAILTAEAPETAALYLDAAPTAYSADADYVAGTPVPTTLTGFTAKGGTTQLPDTCSAAFTFSTAAVPAGLVAMQSTLRWNGRTYTVHSWRERHYRGVVNGVTLYLKR